MKFDFVISNPPYHEETANTSDKPVYNYFMSECRKIADKVILITPARFLFNAGKTPKKFNQTMLKDKHLKVLHYEPDSKKIFRNRNVYIEGGVVVTLYDNSRTFEPIETFTVFPELNGIMDKVQSTENFQPFSEIIYAPESYHFTEKFHADNPNAAALMSKGHANDLTTNVFKKLTDYFSDAAPDDGNEYVRIYGRLNNQRVYKFIRRDYVNTPAPLDKFKIFVPKSNGSGALGKVIPTPLIGNPVLGEPHVGCTQTFITVGAFDTRAEADACLKYIKTKFARVMLGILKATQDNKAATWAKVPLQNFTANGDIDWSADISDIDAQLYRKYGLSAAEVEFIESHVKELT